MFLKTKQLKKLMKEAWSGSGLMIGRTTGYYTLEGSSWAAWVRPGFLPKEIKAAMIELGGEIPEEGEVYECWKKEAPQYEIDTRTDLEKMWGIVNREVHPSHVYIQEVGERYNVIKADRMILLNEKLLAAVGDPTDEDYQKGEYDTGFPLTEGNVIMWQNNACMFLAVVRAASDNAREWLNSIEEVF